MKGYNPPPVAKAARPKPTPAPPCAVERKKIEILRSLDGVVVTVETTTRTYASEGASHAR